MARKIWQIENYDEATRRWYKAFAAQEGLTLPQALKRVTEIMDTLRFPQHTTALSMDRTPRWSDGSGAEVDAKEAEAIKTERRGTKGSRSLDPRAATLSHHRPSTRTINPMDQHKERPIRQKRSPLQK